MKLQFDNFSAVSAPNFVCCHLELADIRKSPCEKQTQTQINETFQNSSFKIFTLMTQSERQNQKILEIPKQSSQDKFFIR